MRSTGDFFGLLAYLTLMYGRLPDRGVLTAAWDDDEPTEPWPRLALVSPPETASREAEAEGAAAA